jgi:guanylate kinase
VSRQSGPVVLVAPSGTGKTTLAHKLVEGPGNFVFSVSATTRPARQGETDGKHYHFVDRPTFQVMVGAGELAEWAEVHGRLYGTPRAELERAAATGDHVVLDIDVQGARQIRERVPDATVIFVLPPDVATLMTRLRGRGTESRADVARRLRSALEELQAVEEFDYVVVNDDLERCLETIRGIVSGQVPPLDCASLKRDAEAMREEIGRILDEEYAEFTNA